MLDELEKLDEAEDQDYVLRYARVKTIEEKWIERARSNVADFITYISDGEHTPADHHLDWLEAIFDKGSSRTNIVAFPGSGKTSILIYALAWYIGKKPWLTHIITSAAGDQAKDRLAAVREIIKLNQRYKNVFPWIEIDYRRPNNSTQLNIWSKRWKGRETEIDYGTWRSLISRFGNPKDHTLFAGGITSKSIEGKRVSGLAIVDDPHDAINSATPQQRAKVIFFFRKTFLTRLTPTPDAKAVVISTRWAEDDLPGVLLDEKRADGTPAWKSIITPIEDENGVPTWPGYWTKARIDDRAEEVGGRDGPMFQLSYLNNPTGLSTGEFNKDMLRIPLPSPMPMLKEIFITVDVAHKDKKENDYTVFTAIGRDMEKNFGVYVLDIMRFKQSQIDNKTNELADFYEQVEGSWGAVNYIIFEDVDSDAEVQSLRAKRPDIPIKVIQTKGDKEVRLGSVAAKAQQGKLYINQTMKFYAAMVSELLAFPKGKHDDIADTLSLAFQIESWRQVRMKVEKRNVISPLLLVLQILSVSKV